MREQSFPAILIYGTQAQQMRGATGSIEELQNSDSLQFAKENWPIFKKLTAMNELLRHYWWALALRGVIAILFGVLALMWPGLTLLSLILLYAAYSLLGGVVAIIGAVKNRRGHKDWWLPLLFGLVSIGAGVVALAYPILTGLILVLLIAANALITGILDIVLALRASDRFKQDKWLLVASGAASIVFGAVAFLYPGAGALALIWMISFYAIFTGVLLLAVAISIRGKAKTNSQPERRVNAERRMSADRP